MGGVETKAALETSFKFAADLPAEDVTKHFFSGGAEGVLGVAGLVMEVEADEPFREGDGFITCLQPCAGICSRARFREGCIIGVSVRLCAGSPTRQLFSAAGGWARAGEFGAE